MAAEVECFGPCRWDAASERCGQSTGAAGERDSGCCGGKQFSIDQEQPKTAHTTQNPQRGHQAGSSPLSFAQFTAQSRGLVRDSDCYAGPVLVRVNARPDRAGSPECAQRACRPGRRAPGVRGLSRRPALQHDQCSAIRSAMRHDSDSRSSCARSLGEPPGASAQSGGRRCAVSGDSGYSDKQSALQTQKCAMTGRSGQVQ